MNSRPHKRIWAFLKSAGFDLKKPETDIILLAQGGSDRCFYRIRHPGGSMVVMLAPHFTHEIRAYVSVNRFLCQHGINVPEIIEYNDDRQMVLMEDIGDDSMYLLLKKANTEKKIMRYYTQAIKSLVSMQIKTTPSIEDCNYLKHRTFGYEAMRWETDYFLECFVKRFCRMEIENEISLEDELHRLSSVLAVEPRYFMHRDYQSQNIFFKDGKVKIIDFQTATRGILQYDLASLLRDSYFSLSRQQVNILLNYYMDLLEKRQKTPVDRKKFIQTFHLAGIQRNMQALGAFAYLSMDKGKTAFLQFIPTAANHLKEALELFPKFRELNRVSEKISSIPMTTQGPPVIKNSVSN